MPENFAWSVFSFPPMPLRNELEEFTMYMLEDHRVGSFPV
jgi:hypothetical protein